jgi:soluble lytic murein transglycosylase-like protein
VSVEDQIRLTAASYGVSPDLAVAVARAESGLNQAARGSSGEIGVFQLMPATAADLGVNPSDLSENIAGGVRYLAEQLRRFGSTELALAAYNAGPGRVASGSIPASTAGYVSRVFAFLPASSPALPPMPAPFQPAASPDALLLAAAALGVVSLALVAAG